MEGVFEKVNHKVNLRRSPPGHHNFKGRIFEKPVQKYFKMSSVEFFIEHT